MDLRNYAVKETLKDGSVVTIRAIRREDEEAIRAIFANLDEESTYRRFFGPKKELTDAELVYFTDVDFNQIVALVATVPTGAGEALIAGGRFAAEGPAPARSAELAFTTEERYRGRGLADLLLRHLVGIAKELGVPQFDAPCAVVRQIPIELFSVFRPKMTKHVTPSAFISSLVLDHRRSRSFFERPGHLSSSVLGIPFLMANSQPPVQV